MNILNPIPFVLALYFAPFAYLYPRDVFSRTQGTTITTWEKYAWPYISLTVLVVVCWFLNKQRCKQKPPTPTTPQPNTTQPQGSVARTARKKNRSPSLPPFPLHYTTLHCIFFPKTGDVNEFSRFVSFFFSLSTKCRRKTKSRWIPNVLRCKYKYIPQHTVNYYTEVHTTRLDFCLNSTNFNLLILNNFTLAHTNTCIHTIILLVKFEGKTYVAASSLCGHIRNSKEKIHSFCIILSSIANTLKHSGLINQIVKDIMVHTLIHIQYKFVKGSTKSILLLLRPCFNSLHYYIYSFFR